MVCAARLLRRLAFQDFVALAWPRLDLDGPRLHGLRHLAHQLDEQQAVLEAGAGDPDVVRQIEPAVEDAIPHS